MGEGLEGISPAQAAQIEPYREHWLRVALSTEPADHERTEEAIRDLYRLVDADPPVFVWCPSPKVAVEVLRERGLEKEYDLYDAMQGVTRAALEDPLGAMLWPSVRPPIGLLVITGGVRRTRHGSRPAYMRMTCSSWVTQLAVVRCSISGPN